jgi:hypothetical protein
LPSSSCIESDEKGFSTVPESICARFGLMSVDDDELDRALAHIPGDEDNEDE